MSTYFCQTCAGSFEILKPESLTPLTATSAQLSKFEKHTTMPTSVRGFVSVFTEPASEAYTYWTVAALTLGFIEQDSRKRISVVLPTSKQIGITTLYTIPVSQANAVRVVCLDNPLKIHPFPFSLPNSSISCSSCSNTL